MTGQMQGETEARSPATDNEDIVLVTACHKGQRLPLGMVKYMMMLKGLASAYQVTGSIYELVVNTKTIPWGTLCTVSRLTRRRMQNDVKPAVQNLSIAAVACFIQDSDVRG